jgi:hypothetical protein
MFGTWFAKKDVQKEQRSVQRKPVRLRLEKLEDRCVPAVDVILEWNTVATNAVRVDHTAAPQFETAGPTRTARALAMVHVAMFDAMNSIQDKFKPLMGDFCKTKNANKVAAVAQAAHNVLVELYPGQQVAFDAALTQTLARIKHQNFKARGILIGQRAADAILEARLDDGNEDDGAGYTPSGAPGNHAEDPFHPGQGFNAPNYGAVTPFVIDSVTNPLFPNDPPPAMDSAEYAAAFNELKMLGGDGDLTPTTRTEDQTQIGIFWGYDGSPGLGTPPVLYNQIAQTIAIQQGNTQYQNARLFALVNLAMADAGIVSWNTKYTHDFWRPVLGIQNGGIGAIGDTDGNADTVGDPLWRPLGAPRSNPFPGEDNFTPPFPAYTSGHATFGAALFEMLENFYGTASISFTIGSDEFNGITRDQDGSVRPLLFRSYTSFEQAKEENGQSRVYLGIHWAFDKTMGIAQGNAVADYIFSHAMKAKKG